jgi:hypothetical protein
MVFEMDRRLNQSTPSEPMLESLTSRVRGEYLEMPGLRLTLSQASRLWQMDLATCESVLLRLVSGGFLVQTEEGVFMAPTSTTRRQLKTAGVLASRRRLA